MMGWLVAGLILAGVFLLLLQWWSTADTPQAKAMLKWLVIGLAVAVAGFLLATGRGFAAIFPVAFAWWQTRARQQKTNDAGANRSKSHTGTMTRAEAADVLGVDMTASEAEIRSAYKKLMAQNHPDKGGSNWLAAKLNEALEVMLGKR